MNATIYNDKRSVLITEPEVHRGEPPCSSATQGKAFTYVQTTIITTTANGDRNVARKTRPGGGPRCNCILTSPIQKAQLHTPTTKRYSEVKYTNPVRQKQVVVVIRVHGVIFKQVDTGRQYLCWKTRHALDAQNVHCSVCPATLQLPKRLQRRSRFIF